jgi:hypothetical protein
MGSASWIIEILDFSTPATSTESDWPWNQNANVRMKMMTSVDFPAQSGTGYVRILRGDI